MNQRRLIWTRWTGVPLQAWTRRFFNWASSEVRCVVEVHELTESRRKLDVAYVRMIIGLNSVDATIAYKIDGASFNSIIKDICCIEKENALKRGWETDYDSIVGLLEDEGSVASDSFAACRGGPALPTGGEAGLAHEGENSSNSALRALGSVAYVLSKTIKVA